MSWWSSRGGGPGNAHKVGLPEERKALVERYMIDAEEAELRSGGAASANARTEDSAEQAQRAAEKEARVAAARQARIAAAEQARREAAEQARRAAEEQARREAAEEHARREAAEAQAQREAAEAQARREAAEAQAQREAAEAQARREAAEAQARREAAEAQARREAADEHARREAARQQAERDSAREPAVYAAMERKQGGAPMNSYLRAALRMWWLVLIGVLAGGYVAVHIAKKHKPPTYSASAKVLVDSTERPFLRTGITQDAASQPGHKKVKKVPGTGATVTTTTPSQPGQATEQQPNTQILVQAANLYPMLVTSDPVASLRKKLYGDVQGTVTAKALYANAGVVKFTPSQFPIIEIDAVSKSEKDAIKLANTTSLALRHWVMKNQHRSRVPRAQRIVLRPLDTARTAVKQTQTRLGLALVVGAGVLAVFYALAVGLDLLIPRRRRRQQTVQASDEEHAPAIPPVEA